MIPARVDTPWHRRVIVASALALLLMFGQKIARADTTVPTLYMISAGVSHYTDIMPLLWAHKDAQDLAAYYAGQEGRLFTKVEVVTLIDGQATVSNIQTSIEALRGRSQFNDYVMILLSGHGGKGNHPEYSYCSYDKNFSWSQIQSALQGVSGRIILMLDTCEAGAVTFAPNVIVYCSSLGHQVSGEESAQITNGNGYFTKALLEALSGLADADGNGIVTLAEADAYIASRVEKISNGKQSPTLMRPPNVPSSLPLAKISRGITKAWPTTALLRPIMMPDRPAIRLGRMFQSLSLGIFPL